MQEGVDLDFYEEILTLVDTLTINTISPLMWQVFYLIKEAFYRDAADYFAGRRIVCNRRAREEFVFFLFFCYDSEIMNCLHNYVVNDTPAFLSQPDRLEIVFEMCKHVIDRKSSADNAMKTKFFFFVFRSSLMI